MDYVCSVDTLRYGFKLIRRKCFPKGRFELRFEDFSLALLGALLELSVKLFVYF